jgi:hypothetical protein
MVDDYLVGAAAAAGAAGGAAGEAGGAAASDFTSFSAWLRSSDRRYGGEFPRFRFRNDFITLLDGNLIRGQGIVRGCPLIFRFSKRYR